MRHRNVPLAFAAMIVLALAVCQKSAGRMGAEEQGGMGDIRLAPDFATMHAIADAYKPEMDRIFQETYGARILSLHPWPASMIYCRGPVSGISDLAGKKIRVHSATLGDFVEGAGGVTVTLPFAEVVPALEKGVADCAITDPVSAYKASWQEVVDYVFALPVGYSITFTAINNSVWDKLDEESRTALSDALAEMEAKGWQQAEANQAIGVACLTGAGECPWGEPGKAALTTPSSEDEAARQKILSEFVLKRWGERCGADCADTWNATAGKAAADSSAATGWRCRACPRHWRDAAMICSPMARSARSSSRRCAIRKGSSRRGSPFCRRPAVSGPTRR